jgi:hypothetical protein
MDLLFRGLRVLHQRISCRWVASDRIGPMAAAGWRWPAAGCACAVLVAVLLASGSGPSSAVVFDGALPAPSSTLTRPDAPPPTLSGWMDAAFLHLPCFEDAEAGAGPDAPTVIHGEYRVAGADRGASLLTWPGMTALLQRFMDMQGGQLMEGGRWPLDPDAPSTRVAHLLAAAEPGDAPMPFVQRLLLPAGSTVAVFGDLHGSLPSLLRSLHELAARGYLGDDLAVTSAHAGAFFMLFLGDYVDRGPAGVETLALLLLLRTRNPGAVFLARGNHEDSAMNGGELEDGSFHAELRAKFSGVPEGELESVFRVYDLLPAAIYLGVRRAPHSGAGADSGAVDNTQACRDSKYLLCCHGGLEVGYDPSPLLESVEAWGEGAPAHGNATASGDAVVQYALIHGLRRADWLAGLDAGLRRAIPGHLHRYFQNYGRRGPLRGSRPGGGRGEAAVAADGFAHARDVNGESDDAGLPYPVPGVTDMFPPLGFMWWDFTVHDMAKAVDLIPGRSLVMGRPVTAAWARGNGRVVGVLRAHQHNNARAAGPMMTALRDGRGLHDNWNASGLVLTHLSGAHIPGMGFHYDSFNLLVLGSGAPAHWTLQHCANHARRQHIRLASGWVEEPLPEGVPTPSVDHACNAATEFECEAVAWRAGAVAAEAGANDACLAGTGG